MSTECHTGQNVQLSAAELLSAHNDARLGNRFHEPLTETIASGIAASGNIRRHLQWSSTTSPTTRTPSSFTLLKTLSSIIPEYTYVSSDCKSTLFRGGLIDMLPHALDTRRTVHCEVE
jgi:hypothetical protein